MTLWVDPPGAVALATRLRGMAAEVDESLSRAGAWEVMAAAAAVGLQRAITQADGVGAVQAARCVAEVETAVLQVVARVHALRGELLALAGAFVRAARVLGAVEDGVANALARLDTLAHDHPDTVEWLAARGHEHALGPLLAAGERGGLLVEGPHQFVGIDTGPPRDVTAPKGLADLVADDIAVEEGDGFVRITEVTRPDGTHAWVVAISGTKVLDPALARTPSTSRPMSAPSRPARRSPPSGSIAPCWLPSARRAGRPVRSRSCSAGTAWAGCSPPGWRPIRPSGTAATSRES